MHRTSTVTRAVLAGCLASTAPMLLGAAQPIATITSADLTPGKSYKPGSDARVEVRKSPTSDPSYQVGMGTIERAGADVEGQGVLLNPAGSGDDPEWHVEAGFAAITTDLIDLPTWTTDRTHAGGVTIMGAGEGSGSGEQTDPGPYYHLIEVNKDGSGDWIERVYCFEGNVRVTALKGGQHAYLEPGEYTVVYKKGVSTVVIESPRSFVSDPDADAKAFLCQVAPKLKKLDMDLPMDLPYCEDD